MISIINEDQIVEFLNYNFVKVTVSHLISIELLIWMIVV